ncbi:efflux RND transporter permease subunit [Salinisphaera sp. LB1]|uniref:efflux RND transporter permease subunit n=1 Tax=Salinisphaera sp. LB1 TaxID=2183911 RepID=UPI000D7082D2|nr:efflux RND transporter permease subunit [Salinisphaera sp. LB1]AWN14480.1 Cobalt-zinc-cadmium resistance protein CzcA [Salinisphaera sp. LB1]
MLKRLVTASLRHRWVVLALAVLLVVYGGYRFVGAHYGVFPQFAPPQVVIQTEAPGLAPRQVEQLVTTPVESAVNGVPGLQSLRSGSILGLSVITATFDPNTDIYRDRQVVAERLASIAGQLPAAAQAPVMTPLTSATGTVLVVGLSSKSRSLMALHTVAQWTVRRRLLAVHGVSKVTVFGGRVRQLQIQPNPQKLIQYGLSVADLASAARRATGVRGTGFIETHNQRIELQTRGQSITPKALADVTLTTKHSVPITLGDVATVKAAPAPPVGAALINGQPGVELIVSTQYGANTLQVTQRLDAALKGLRPTLKAAHIQMAPDLFRPAAFVHRAVGNLQTALAIGGVLVAVVLFLFLFNWRTALISLVAIPLSLLTATLVLELLGYTLNTMTLGGLAIAIGLLVDDAVITVENIYRRLRENQAEAQPRTTLRVVRDATLEVRSAVVYATLAIAMVFIPIVTLPGVSGRLFGPLAYAYIIATLASLAVALTVTPALSFWLLAHRRLKSQEPPVTGWLKPRYGRLLERVERHYRWVIATVLLATVAGLVAVPFLGARFIPELKEGHYIVHMVEAAGTSLPQTVALGKTVTRKLLQLPSVRSVAQKAGRAPQAEDILGTNSSEFDVDLKPLTGAQSEAARRAIQKVLASIPGANFAVKTFLSERIEETISGQTAPVVIHVFGKDLDTINQKAEAIAGIVRQIPGASGVRLQAQPNSPKLLVTLIPAALKRWGFHPLDVLDTLHTVYGGDVVGQVYDGDRIFDVSVILPPKDRSSVADVGSLLIKSASGVDVPLKTVARVAVTTGRATILHEGGRRVATVTANVVGGNVASFVAQAKQRIAQSIHLPAGSYVEYAGTAQTQSQSTQQLLVSAAIAGVFIVLLLSVVLAWPRNLLLILVNLPFALVGGVLAVLALMGATLSMGGMVGFVTVFGITLRNSIMLIAHYEHLVRVEGVSWSAEAAMRGAQERLAPILMTALVTALGLLPLALTSEAPGNAIEGPMAIVILGGLITSTLLNLLVMPALALRYGRFSDPQSVKA